METRESTQCLIDSDVALFGHIARLPDNVPANHAAPKLP